ncbi:hypothetical protein CRG98_028358 [Punica granatum]|uniref:Uncharacterized protein n=1 Tax=Punica granatum TaxID=22663 RepID=A0A2I0J5Q3_PUNGR|nr:hypothetical protein CRG98_028358 [Punica granatum]
MEAVLPIEVEIPSMRIIAEAELEEAKWESSGKFSYKYDGPFVVKEVFSRGAVVLSDMDGTENALPVNADALKKYYP